MNYADNTMRRVKQRFVALLVACGIEVVVVALILLGEFQEGLIYLAAGNAVLMFVIYGVCAFTVCPACGWWFYRSQSRTRKGFAEDEVDITESMAIVRFQTHCQSCGAGWSF